MKVTLFASLLFSIFTFSSSAFAQGTPELKKETGKVTEIKLLDYKKAELQLPSSVKEKGFEHKVQTYNPSRVWRLRFYFTQVVKPVTTNAVVS